MILPRGSRKQAEGHRGQPRRTVGTKMSVTSTVVGSTSEAARLLTIFSVAEWPAASTFFTRLSRYQMRGGITATTRPTGASVRIVSSNKRVKSKPPRHVPAWGPNKSSIWEHERRGDRSMVTEIEHEIRAGRETCGARDKAGEGETGNGKSRVRITRQGVGRQVLTRGICNTALGGQSCGKQPHFFS